MPQSREIELSKAISMPGSLMNTTGNALDVRYVAKNETDRISIPQASRYVGLQVYQSDTKTLYVLKDNSTAEGTWEKVAISGLDQDLQAKNIEVSQSILPTTNGQQDIGSPDKRFRSIYVDEAYLSTNTLYIGDTPILGTDADTVMIKADPDQSINLKTSGTGTAKITSQSTAEISTSGMNADVVVQATGQGSMVRASATEEVRLEAPDVSLKGNVSISKDLTVDGNVKIKGSTFEVDSTTVTTKDNIIVLNKGEVGSGVTKGSAGIQVDRGDATDYQFIFDEQDDMFKIGMLGDLQTVATRPYVDNAVAGKANASHSHSNATTAASGFMSNTDKAKLDGIAANSTKVEKSSTNGNIKINGTETPVYVHPAGTNPHGTTKADVGLGNVPNVTTDDQTPTFTASSTLANLTSGEKLSSMLGKLSKAITDLSGHLTNRSNPHGVTTSQIGAETPAGAQAKVNAHASDEDIHITAAERELWNNGTQGPKGDKGDKGDTGATGAAGKDGAAATITVGTVTTGVAGTNASVTNVGTTSAAKLDFTIPRGATGAQGPQGEKGDKGEQGIQGPAGADGLTTSVTVNGTKYSHSNGNITLPNYPTLSSLGAAASGHSHSAATTSANGFMSATDKTKLDGIAAGATKVTVDSALSSSSTNPVQNKVINTALAGKANSSHTHAISDVTNLQSTLDGKASTSHTHSNATTSAAGFMSSSDKSKLDGVASGAQVNQNAFSNVTVGSTTIAADSATDTLTLVAGSNVTITPDATNDKITIAATNTTYGVATGSANGLMSSADKSKLDGIAAGANNYVHPATHDASMITESSSKRFVSDSEKSTWNAKETTSGSQAKADAALNSAKSYTDTKVAALVNSAPEALDTLGELAVAIQENEDAYDGLLTTVGGKADKTYVDTELAKKANSSHTHAISNITNLQSSLDAKAPLASPTLTGTPTAPTASAGTNNTQVATTAFVTTAVNNKTSVSGNAGTATKLQTARTINGTSFDGSANITTANWGTARTITVGNTGKSVNGSGDVSWSLNEIGAMPGSTISGTTAATAGWYRIAQTTSSNQDNTIGSFQIKAACSGNHSSTILNAGITYGVNPVLQQLSHTQYNSTGISQVRIVYHTTYSGNTAYLEVYVPTAAARTITVQLEGSQGWTLVAPSTAGSIPSGYTTKTITLTAGRMVSDVAGALSGNASTATTLQTARTINGTSFNGSANITTANWGTARTLTIGNTGKSVNGSGSVSWSLSEIGALPLTGGTVTGQVNFNSTISMANKYIYLSQDSTNPKIGYYINSDDTTKNATIISNGSNNWLRLIDDGTLTWKGKNVVVDGLTGNFSLVGGTYIHGIDSTAYTGIEILTGGSGTWSNGGAGLVMASKNATARPGWFMLRTGDGSTYTDLIGKPDGTLTWGNTVIRKGGIYIKSSDADGADLDGLVVSDGTNRIQIDPNEILVTNGTTTGWAPVYFNSSNVQFQNGTVTFPNGESILAKNSSGANKILCGISTENNVFLGSRYSTNTHSGDTNIYSYSGNVNIYVKANGASVQLAPADSGDTSCEAYFRPNPASKIALGTTAYRWYCTYQYLGSVNTSDKRAKHDITAISDLPATLASERDENFLEVLFDKLVPKTYYMNDDNDGKMRIGFVAQDIAESLAEIGVSENELGLISHDYWTDDETGEEKDAYGLGYSEFIALNTHMIQKTRKENEELKRLIVAQQAQYEELKAQINELKAS